VNEVMREMICAPSGTEGAEGPQVPAKSIQKACERVKADGQEQATGRSPSVN